MNCHEIEPLLSALVDNELTPEERHTVQEHLRGCAICWRTLTVYQSFNKAALAVLPARVVVPEQRRWPIPTALPRVGAAVLATVALSGSAALGWLALHRPTATPGRQVGRAPATITVPAVPSQVAASQQLT